MPITRTPMVDDDGSGTTGTIINNAWKQEFYGQIDAFAGGVYTPIPYDPSMFSASSGGTWTPTAANVPTLGVTLINAHFAAIQFSIIQSPTSGNPAQLYLVIPPAFIPACICNLWIPISYFAGGAPGTGIVNMNNGTRNLWFSRDFVGTPFVGGGDTWITGQIVYPY